MKVFLALLIFGIVTLTGCANLGLGDNPLMEFASRIDGAFQEYQAGVTSGEIDANDEVNDAYLDYRLYFKFARIFLKPSATPPPEMTEAGNKVTTAIDAAKKASAAKSKAARAAKKSASALKP